MRHRSAVAALAIVAACLLQPKLASAQIPADLQNDKIKIDYYEPRDANLLPVYGKIYGRHVLEELSQFLAPVQWPKTLRLLAKECPASQALSPQVYYSKIEYSITICYQWFSFLQGLKPQPAFGTQQQVIVGGLVGAVLHESASAIFDMFNVPILGSEDDAADQLMTFIALQFSDAVAQTVIKGTYFVWKTYDGQISNLAGQSSSVSRYDWASAKTVPAQRMANILCIAYGRPSSSLKTFVDQGNLLSTRAPRCADEYAQGAKAFTATVVPNVNTNLMKEAQSVTWLTPADLQ